MRIIGGTFGGIRLNPPTSLPVRPTTDMAKEALFNILQNRLDFDGLRCLDLFAGTGNISFELASRGVLAITAVDIHFKCLEYISQTAAKMNIKNIQTKKGDVFKYIQTAKGDFDFIFADPPYDIAQLPQLAEMVLAQNLLHPEGLLVVEHPSSRHMEASAHYVETRKYGNSSFSFYRLSSPEEV